MLCTFLAKSGYCTAYVAYHYRVAAFIETLTREKPFVCEVCSYKCSRESYLNQNMRVHTGEKPFACDLCVQKLGEKTRKNTKRFMEMFKYNWSTDVKNRARHVLNFHCQ